MSSPAVKFISITPDAGPAKPKRARHACESCRKLKKRCLHDYQRVRHGPAVSQSVTTSNSNTNHELPRSSTQPTRKRLRGSTGVETSFLRSSPPSARRNAVQQETDVRVSPVAQASFSPHSESPGSSTEGTEGDREPRFVGHLNPQGFFLATTRHGASEASKHGENLGFWLPQESWNHMKDVEQRVNDVKISQHPTSTLPEPARPGIGSVEPLPPQSSFQALRAIFFRDIHPVFPILHPEVVPETVPESSHTVLAPTEAILIQALCIAVATNKTAKPHLCLGQSAGAVTPREFAKSLSRSTLATLERYSINDRLLLIRVFTVLSLFSAFSSDDHTAAEYCARAVSNVHTMQLQLDTLRIRRDNTVVTQIFLCVWALDRFSAAFHSRPSLMHDRDIGRDMDASIAVQPGGFRALLVTCGLLDEVIDLYRPTHRPNQETRSFDMPSFDELVVQADAVHCPTHLLATIESLYHAIAMLSHRFHSLDDPDRSSMSYLRSSLSAARVVHLIGTDITHPLSNFPFVPYSVALALRVSYRELRLSKTPLYRLEARRQVLLLCTVLAEFGNDYIFAKGLSRIASKIIREMDKVASSALQAHQKDTDHLTASHRPLTSTYRETGAVHQHQPTSVDATSQYRNRMTDSTGHYEYPEPPHMTGYDSGSYDAESFEDVHKFPNLPDIFDHFDPDFDLEGVDFALIQNLGLYSWDGIDSSAHAS